MRIYITHCSKKKDDSLRGTTRKVTPDKLYSSRFLQGFIKKCQEAKVNWAIFSDKYGVVFPNDKIAWYEKNPSRVTKDEFARLVEDFNRKLNDYKEIWFYNNPGRFHRLYKELICSSKLKDKIVLFSHKSQIV